MTSFKRRGWSCCAAGSTTSRSRGRGSLGSFATSLFARGVRSVGAPTTEENAPPADAVATFAPDDRAALVEAKRSVLQVLESLDPTYREVVYLRYFDNLNSTQIAHRLAVSPSAVRTRLQRALQAMRAQLDSSWSGDARSLAFGLSALAMGWAPQAERGLGLWQASRVSRWGAAAAVMLAAVTWWASMSVQTSSASTKHTVSAAFVSSEPPRSVSNNAGARRSPQPTPVATRRLVASTHVKARAGISAGDSHGTASRKVQVTYRAEPSGQTVECKLPFDRTQLVDLTALTHGVWPVAIWVQARHGSWQTIERVEVAGAIEGAVRSLRVSLALGPHRRDGEDANRRANGGPTGPVSGPASDAARDPSVRGSAPASPEAMPTVRRRATSRAPSGSAAAVLVHEPGFAGIPTLRRRQPNVRNGSPRASDANPRSGSTGADISSRVPSTPAQWREYYGDRAQLAELPALSGTPEGFTVDARELPASIGGAATIVVRVESQRDDVRYWVGDEFGPHFELPDTWKQGDPIRMDGLWPGRYRIFSENAHGGWQPRSSFEVAPFERSALVLRDRVSQDFRVPHDPLFSRTNLETARSGWPLSEWLGISERFRQMEERRAGTFGQSGPWSADSTRPAKQTGSADPWLSMLAQRLR